MCLALNQDEATKITKTKVEDKPDQFEVINNIELIHEPQIISPVAAPTTQDSSAETGKVTVHTASRATEDIDKVAKTNGMKSSHKGKDNNNNNLGFMDIEETVKNIEIHEKKKRKKSSLRVSVHQHTSPSFKISPTIKPET